MASEQMNPAVEYRHCPRLPEEIREHVLIGKDGSAWTYFPQWKRWIRLKAAPCRNSYYRVAVRSPTRKKVCIPLAHAVLSAFGNPRPLGMEVFYRNGDKSDCSFSNLAWAPRGTYKAGRPFKNARRVRPGNRNVRTVLNERKVAWLREQYRAGESVASLAQELGMSEPGIRGAITGKSWPHVPGAVRMRTLAEAAPRGAWSPSAKLADDEVIHARQLYAGGHTLAALAERFEVSQSTIAAAVAGRSWSHLPGAQTVRRRNPAARAKPEGLAAARAKLSRDQVILMRRQYAAGRSTRDIASDLGCSHRTAAEAISGQRYREIPGAVQLRTRIEACWVGRGPQKVAPTEEAVRRARDQYRRGHSVRDIAAELGVSRSAARSMLIGTTWRHVEGAVQMRAQREAVPRGERGSSAKLSQVEVLEARRLRRHGESWRKIAEQLGRTIGAIRSAVEGRSWSHLPGAVVGRRAKA